MMSETRSGGIGHLLAAAWVGLAMALSVGGTAAMGADGSARPNLLIIHTDEHNFRTLGCYRELLPKQQALMWGDAVVETPQIDWIAHHGAICTSFYATTPVCSPSRSAFTTGCYPQTTGVTTNNIQMHTDMVTFAETLRRNGYATGYAGKWHLNGPGRPEWGPLPRFGFADNRYMFNRGHWKQLEDTATGPRVAARKNGKPTYAVNSADEKTFTTDFLATKTIDFIRVHKGGPFCFMVSIPDPHGPDTVRPPYDTMYAGQTYTKPRSYDAPTAAALPSWAARTKCGFGQAKYYGMVKCIDDNVGRILQCLRDEGLIDTTIVVFTSDHGDLRGEHARQNKGVPFEGSARIPFVVHAPGKIAPGTVVNEALGCVDFKPTIFRIMDIEDTAPVEGRDCSSLLIRGKRPENWDDTVFIRGTSNAASQWVAAVSDRYKLVCSVPDQPWLFDLEKDPDELVNSFADPACREVVRTLCRKLIQYGKKFHDARVANECIQYDLAWGSEGTGAYSLAQRPVPPSPATKRKR